MGTDDQGVCDRRGLTVAYAAFGETYVREAAISAWSVKRHMPGATTLIVTDAAVESPHFDRVIRAKPAPPGTSAARHAKAHKGHAILSAASKAVLFLDSDAYLLSDISGVVQALDGNDFAAAHDTWRYGDVYRRLHPGMDVPEFPSWHPFFNTGVLFVNRSPSVDAFLEEWSERVARDSRIVLDQLDFRTLLWHSALRVNALPAEYNLRPGAVSMSGRVHVIHRRMSPSEWRWSSPFLADFLNSDTRNRAYTPHDERLVIVTEDYRFIERWLADYVPTVEKECHLRPSYRIAKDARDPPSVPATRAR